MLCCPICKARVSNRADDPLPTAFPFCSDRCRLVDLGRWLDGRYQIAETPDEDADDGTPRQREA